jgi:hypothetical protein
METSYKQKYLNIIWKRKIKQKNKIVMKKTVIIIFCLILSICNHLFSQENNLNRTQIDSLRKAYCLDCKNYFKSIEKDSLLSLPPPPNSKKYRKDFRCEKKFNIPDSLFLTVFPFNADSIMIAAPRDSCENKIHILRKMTSEETGQFASILYNYDYRKKAEITMTHYAWSRTFPPNVALLFYNNGKSDFLYLFFEGNQLLIKDSFSNDDTDIYWGECCDERYNLLKQFFLDNYNYKIFNIPCCPCETGFELEPIKQ